MPKSAGKLRPRRRPLLAASLGRPGTGGWKTQGLEPPSPHLASSEFSRSTQSDCHSRIKEWGKGGETEAHGRRYLDQGHRMRQRRTETSRGARFLQPVAPGWAPHAHAPPHHPHPPLPRLWNAWGPSSPDSVLQRGGPELTGPVPAISHESLCTSIFHHHWWNL